MKDSNKGEMKVVTLDVSKIKPYENNPRNNKDAVDGVAESIKQFGWQQPIVVDKDGVIIVGHTRFLAAKKLGMKQVPAIVADSLTEEQVKAYRVFDNSTGELATWDLDLLGKELNGLFNYNLNLFGFDADLMPKHKPELKKTSVEDLYAGLPEELRHADLTPEQLAELKGDDKTAYQRIIITYAPDQKEFLEKILGIEINKIIYTAEELEE